MIKSVIFDMDGVIVDSEACHEEAFRQVLRQAGFGSAGAWRYKDFIGRSDQELFVAFEREHPTGQGIPSLLAIKTRLVVEIIRRERPLFQGVTRLIGKLAGRYSLALASGSEREVVEEVLRLDGLGRFFSAVVAGSEVARGKPEPGIFLRAAEMLNVAPADCWVVEDSKPGIAAGLAAGMRVIAIANTHRPAELAQAAYVVESCEELEPILLGEG